MDGFQEGQFLGGKSSLEEDGHVHDQEGIMEPTHAEHQEDVRQSIQAEGNVREASGGVRKSSRVRFRPKWLDDYATSDLI